MVVRPLVRKIRHTDPCNHVFWFPGSFVCPSKCCWCPFLLFLPPLTFGKDGYSVKKILCLLAVACIVLSSLVGCGGAGSSGTKATTTTTTTKTADKDK